MEVYINKTHGLRNDLLVVIPRAEIEDVLLHIANRDRLMQLPGLLRHVGEQDPEEKQQLSKCKIPVEDHLKCLTQRGHGLVDADGRPKRRIVAIGSRNVGNNHGFIAWQRDENPKLFHIRRDPLNYPSYSCLVRHKDGQLTVRSLNFKEDKVLEGDRDITEGITWCVYANQILRDGKVVSIEEIIDQFYDIHHVLAYDRDRPEGKQIEAEIYEGYPDRFRENALKAWREKGVPRNRFLHDCLGLSDDNIFIMQREGTIEEEATWLKEAGAKDGFILENGASPACWVWWLQHNVEKAKEPPKGGFLFTAPDFRPNATAVLAFVLKGPVATDLPTGSVSFSVV